ncbi:ADP-glyceromanno-heptose 6-epimerase [Insolitispirillum peregrinum]|uniref:ADP-L-glycero-D-manno-heptose-6-epimerase n=1 Tax=Insolitispirillum peregrinum TaxID=80876 RepID=A0A1N7PEE2_9PROT|nr:ADP-glyceromanno-heptose 6-epimerase [Insolitispirillum peregrinum]SIT09003.1 ADP-glyceromanno-heptose 6-epimerase precursor [Insolitispirillum peregrinum]
MYVVTGGAGFIGSNILAALEERGLRDLVVVDRLRDGVKWRNISKRELSDIVAPEHIFDFLELHKKKLKAIIHMGAISATTERDADKIVTNNFNLTVALYRWCAINEVRFIYASSAATYGDGTAGFDDSPTCEALSLLRPLNAYGWSKHLFDRRLLRQIADGRKTPPQWVGLKFFNVYGPNEYHKGAQSSVVSQVYPRAAQNAHFDLFRSHHPDYADGGQLRDFIWVGDVVNVIMWMLDTPSVSGLFNLGTGKARTFLDLASAVYHSLGKTPNIRFVDTPVSIRDKYQYFTEARMDRLRQAGYTGAFTSLEDGVQQYVQGFLAQPDPYK